MDLIRDTQQIILNIPEALSIYKSEDIVILDIETTGLHRLYSNVILIGLIVFTESEAEIIQLFANNPDEELEILLSLKEIIETKSLFLTYNGQAFDIPYLNEKYKQHEIDFQIPIYKSFDILRLIRKNKSNLKLDNYKLKSIEAFLGIAREDTISGKESIELYKEYVNTKSIDLKNKILLHNFDDILNIIDLMKIFIYCSKNSVYEEIKYPIGVDVKAMTSHEREYLNSTYRGLNIESNIILFMDEVRFNDLEIEVDFYAPDFSYYDFAYQGFGMSLEFDSLSSRLIFRCPILNFELDSSIYTFIDIDSIYGQGYFNNMNMEEKLNLNFSINKILNYEAIIDFINKHFSKIMYVVSK